MYDQVKKSWAKQSVALDVSTVLCPQAMLKGFDFMKRKFVLFMGLNFSILKTLLTGS